MRAWYAADDLLDVPGERRIPESSDFETTVTTILQTSGLATAFPQAACPARCPHCAGQSS